MAGQDGIDLGLVRIQETGVVRSLASRGLIPLQRLGHRMSRAAEPAGNGPTGELLDLGQAANLGPQTDVHGKLLSSWACDSPATRLKISPSCISPGPGSPRRRW